jgi:hypothetical protein
MHPCLIKFLKLQVNDSVGREPSLANIVAFQVKINLRKASLLKRLMYMKHESALPYCVHPVADASMARYDRMGLIWMLRRERVVVLTATEARLSGRPAFIAGVHRSGTQIFSGS